nr:integrase, catalytic region, zinc finger, CCHC-type, peptidase aspartic, catalytic [Tanacetum cinerariifolium]
MIPELGVTNREVPMNETFHVHTDDELTEKELKQIEADDQAIQTILLGLPEDIYAAVDTGSENRPPMLNKKNYVPWLRIIPEPGDPNREVPVNETFHVQTVDELTEKELKKIEADQASTSGTQYDKDPVYDSDGLAEVIQICLWCVNLGCSKHMTGNLKLLINFVWKFLGTVCFGNDHVAVILGFERHVLNTISASARTKPITVSQPHVITKKDVNSNLNGSSSTGVDNTKTRRPQPRSNTKNDRVPSVSKRGKIVDYSESKSTSDCSNGDNACTSNAMEPKIKRFPNSTSLLGRLSRFVCGFGDLQWGNILITRVYFVEGLGHNLFSVGQFCDSDLDVAFRRNACFVRNLEGVDLLKGDL